MRGPKRLLARHGAQADEERSGRTPVRKLVATFCAVAMSVGMAGVSISAYADDQQPAENATTTVEATPEAQPSEDATVQAQPEVEATDAQPEAITTDAAPTADEGLTYSKTLSSQKPDGSYTLSMNLNGVNTEQTSETRKPLDIALVLDVSGSMDYVVSYSPVAADKIDTSKTYYVDTLFGKRRVTYWNGRWYTNFGTTYDPNTTTFYMGTTRWDILKNSVNQFLSEVNTRNQDLDQNQKIKISLIKYAGNGNSPAGTTHTPGNGVDNNGYNYSQIVNHLTSDTQTIADSLNAISPNGGTDATAGLKLAVEELKSQYATSGAEKAAIFYSDGEPDNSNSAIAQAATLKATAGLKLAVEELKSQYATSGAEKAAIFYSDGEPDNSNSAIAQAATLKNIATVFSIDATGSTSNSFMQSIATGDNYYPATDQDSLNKVFELILGQLTSGLSYRDVSMSDTLSQYVDLVDAANVKLIITVTATKKVFELILGQLTSGLSYRDVSMSDTLSQYVDLVDAANVKLIITVTATKKEVPQEHWLDVVKLNPEDVTINTSGKTVSVAFPADYQLANGYTYSLQYDVKPNADAYADYSDGKNLSQAGDQTNTEGYGLKTNNNAFISYIPRDGGKDLAPKKPKFNHPVMKPAYKPVNSGDAFTVKKMVNGSWGDNRFKFTLAPQKGAPGTVDANKNQVVLSESEPQGAFGDIQFTKPGTFIYLVQEDSAEASPSYEYSKAQYQVTVTVTQPDRDNDPATLTIGSITVKQLKDDAGNEPTTTVADTFPMTFTNTSATVSLDTDSKLGVKKTVQGANAPDKTFTFTLKAVDTAQEGLAENEIAGKAQDVTGLDDANSTVTVNYTSDGQWAPEANFTATPTFPVPSDPSKTAVYTFQIAETQDATPGWSYDKNPTRTVPEANFTATPTFPVPSDPSKTAVYTFQIAETQDATPGWSYDKNPTRTVKVNVSYDSQNKTWNAVPASADLAVQDFTNTWVAVSNLPLTGEGGATPMLWLAIGGGLGALALLAAGGAAIWRKRRLPVRAG